MDKGALEVMPLTTPRPCARTGCYRTTRETYCEEHKKEKQRSDWGNKPRVRNKIYSTARWQRLRRMVLRQHPTCATDGCIELATEVDHITPMSAGGAEYDMQNLQALCVSCHSRKTLKEVLQKRN